MQAFVDEVRYELGGRRVVMTLERGQEQRGEAREEILETVQVAPLRDDGTVDWPAARPAVARDLSLSGIGLLQSGLASGSRVVIGMEQGGQLVYLPAEIRH